MTRQARLYALSSRVADPVVSPAALVAGLGLYGIHVGTLRWGMAAWANPIALPPRRAPLESPQGTLHCVPACLRNVLLP